MSLLGESNSDDETLLGGDMAYRTKKKKGGSFLGFPSRKRNSKSPLPEMTKRVEKGRTIYTVEQLFHTDHFHVLASSEKRELCFDGPNHCLRIVDPESQDVLETLALNQITRFRIVPSDKSIWEIQDKKGEIISFSSPEVDQINETFTRMIDAALHARTGDWAHSHEARSTTEHLTANQAKQLVASEDPQRFDCLQLSVAGDGTVTEERRLVQIAMNGVEVRRPDGTLLRAMPLQAIRRFRVAHTKHPFYPLLWEFVVASQASEELWTFSSEDAELMSALFQQHVKRVLAARLPKGHGRGRGGEATRASAPPPVRPF